MDPSTQEMVHGKALLESPIAEAEVRAVAIDGGLLAAIRVPLDDIGLFSLPVDGGLPAGFRIEIEDLSSREVLRAEVRGYEPGWTLVFVSAVSTLVSAYLERHPDSSLEAASAAVKAHLGIPAAADLAYDLADARLPSFDLAAFQEDARSRGGLAAQARELLDQIDAGAEAAAFLPAKPGLRGDFGSELLTNFAGSLAASAAQKVASSLGAPGWMMSLLGGKDEDAIKNRLDEVKKQLGEQKQLLTKVQGQIAELGTDVSKTLDALAAAEEKKSYTLGAALLIEPVAEIGSIGTYFRYLFDLDLTNPSTNLADRKSRIGEIQTKARTKLWISLTQLHDVLTGTAAVEGLIPLWVRTVGRNHAGFPNFVDHVVLDAAHRQLDLYAGHQLAGLQLLIEAYHAETPVNSRLAEKASKSLFARLRQQLELVGGPANLDDRLIVDRRSSLMWHKKGATEEGGNQLPLSFVYSNRSHSYLGPREPIRAIADLRTAGFTGWRLPTKEEIAALVRGSSGRLGEWFDAQGFRIKKDRDAPPYASYFLLADGVRQGGDIGEYLLWDAYTGNIKKVKDFSDQAVFRVFPVRQVWPSEPPRALQQGAQLGGLFDAGARFLLKKIAAGAGSKIGGEATGWILRRLGANTDDPVIGQADAIKAELAEQKQLIQRIGADVATVSRRVAELKEELLELGEKTAYDGAARVLQLQVSKISAIHELLGWMAEADPTVSNKADAEALLALIDDQILTSILNIDLALRPAADREGLLLQWRRPAANRMVPGWKESEKETDPKKRPQFFVKQFLDVINDQWEYYYGAQVLGLQLLVEAEHAKGTSLATQMVGDFSRRIAVQEALILGPRVPDGFIYNDRSKSHWAKAPICPAGHSGADCYFEWAPGGTFSRGTPEAALAAFTKPAGFDCRFLSQADLVGIPDSAPANTFREVFTRAGFESSFGVPIWLAGATAQRPLRMNEGAIVSSDASMAFRFTVLPVCTAKPES